MILLVLETLPPNLAKKYCSRYLHLVYLPKLIEPVSTKVKDEPIEDEHIKNEYSSPSLDIKFSSQS